MRFTTAETDAYVAWGTLQTLFPTRTACGATYRSARGPFCRGDEDAWRRDQADARALDAAFSYSSPERASLYERLAELLDLFPDTATERAAVAQGRTLSEAQLATLHRAIHLAIALDAALAQASLRFSWWDSAAAQPFIQLVGGEPAFCLDALDATLRAASDASARARLALDQGKRNVSRALHEAYGRAMRRDGTLIAPLYDAREAEMLRDPRLRLRLTTREERVYDVVEDAALTRATAQCDACEGVVRRLRAEVLTRVSATLAKDSQTLDALMVQIGRLDDLFGRVAARQRAGFVWSELGDAPKLYAGRPPFYAAFQPVDIALKTRVTLLTGMNMGGKSAALRTLLSAQLLHQWGAPVYASAYRAPLYKALRYIGGDQQALDAGISTFAAEVLAIKEALAEEEVFLCLDEVGRATNPQEGEALLFAILQKRQTARSGVTFAVTHFSRRLPGATHLTVRGISKEALAMCHTPEDLKTHMDYRLTKATGTELRQGIAVAAWLGLPAALVAEASRFMRGDGQSEDVEGMQGADCEDVACGRED